MASTCYNLWRVYTNSKGKSKWVNEGPAPDVSCPSCPDMGFPPDGYWNGSAACSNGNIQKYVADGMGGERFGDILVHDSPVCNGDYYLGQGPISNYYP